MSTRSRHPSLSALDQNAADASGHFPAVRMRRNRKAPWTRELVAENRLSPSDLIWPMFVIEGENKRVPVASMPGVERLSVDLIVEAAKEAVALGIPAVALFPFTDPAKRSDDASEAFNADNLVCRATRAIKKAKLDLGVILDVALDPYTSHGHDGLLVGDEIVNDETNAALVKQSLVQAEAGADVGPEQHIDGTHEQHDGRDHDEDAEDRRVPDPVPGFSEDRCHSSTPTAIARTP